MSEENQVSLSTEVNGAKFTLFVQGAAIEQATITGSDVEKYLTDRGVDTSMAILVNGEPATLSATINAGDIVSVAKNGGGA